MHRARVRRLVGHQFARFLDQLVALEARRARHSFVGHTRSVVSLALLSNESLASGSINAEIRIWNIGTGKCLRTLINTRSDKYAYAVFALQPLPNGRLASGSECGRIKIWKLNNGELVKNLLAEKETFSPFASLFGIKSSTSEVFCLALLSRNILASARGDLVIHIWHLVNYACLSTLKGHSLQLLSDNVLVSASADKSIIKWDLNMQTRTSQYASSRR